MSGRRSATVPQPRPVTRPATEADAVPACPRCGFTGRPGAEFSPYIWCDGDEARHRRPPLASQPDGPQ